MRTRLLPLALVPLVALVAILPGSARADGLPVEGVDASRSGVTGLSELHPLCHASRWAEDRRRSRRTSVAVACTARTSFPGRSRSRRSPTTAPRPGSRRMEERSCSSSRAGPSHGARPRSLSFGTKLLRPRAVITLRGDFSFDALSPDGRWLYLVQYLSRRDPSRYLVRLYDLKTHRLRPEPIIDPNEVGDVMRGMPVTRSSSPDGRFAYTLYDGAGEHPFIHALDTVEKSARCIDLHGLMGFQRLGELKLDVSPDGGSIAVALGRRSPGPRRHANERGHRPAASCGERRPTSQATAERRSPQRPLAPRRRRRRRPPARPTGGPTPPERRARPTFAASGRNAGRPRRRSRRRGRRRPAGRRPTWPRGSRT